MTKITTILASLALVTAVACAKKDDDKATKKNTKNTPENTVKNQKTPATKTTKTVDTNKIKRLSVDELVKVRGTVAILDANSDSVRKQYGKIPTATLLSNYASYKLNELPADKTKGLVFYCSNLACGASKKGAKRALLAGYTNVSVLPVGVKGWKEAGQKTETIQ